MRTVAAVPSLACGAGVQAVAELFPELPVFPAQNAHFIEVEDRGIDTLEERVCGLW